MPLRPAPTALSFALPLLLLAGCERPAGVPAADAPEVPARAEAGGDIDAIRVVDRAPVAGAGGDFDVRAFAGAFEAEGIRLALAPDGTYALATDAGDATGNWSVEADGTRIRLDPDSKADPDRVYTLASGDALVPGDDGQALHRAGD